MIERFLHNKTIRSFNKIQASPLNAIATIALRIFEFDFISQSKRDCFSKE